MCRQQVGQDLGRHVGGELEQGGLSGLPLVEPALSQPS
jgi:hypothetical protein